MMPKLHELWQDQCVPCFFPSGFSIGSIMTPKHISICYIRSLHASVGQAWPRTLRTKQTPLSVLDSDKEIDVGMCGGMM